MCLGAPCPNPGKGAWGGANPSPKGKSENGRGHPFTPLTPRGLVGFPPWLSSRRVVFWVLLPREEEEKEQ
eukprot:3827776-Pyramimonas_sp.AAC.1